MKIAYIAGPYRAETVNGIYENINHARTVARKYWMKGYAVICPHLNSAMMDGNGTDHVFLDGDLEILSRCDVVVMMGAWPNSAGARAELELARKLGKEIIYDNLNE